MRKFCVRIEKKKWFSWIIKNENIFVVIFKMNPCYKTYIQNILLFVTIKIIRIKYLEKCVILNNAIGGNEKKNQYLPLKIESKQLMSWRTNNELLMKWLEILSRIQSNE